MSQTYNEALPIDRDKARSILGATDVTTAEAALISDEHIDAVLLWQGTLDGAVAFLASELAARYAQMPTSVSDSGTSVSWASRLTLWLSLVSRGGGTGVGGGLSFVTASYADAVSVDEFSRPLEFQP